MDRCHRLGQLRPVTVYRMLAESTIESRISNIQAFKAAVAQKVIDDDNMASLEGLNLWDSMIESQR